MLTVSTWLWGRKYGDQDVARLRAGIARHLKQDHHRFVVFRPEPEDEFLTRIPGCFARLRMFDPAWQARHAIVDRLVCVDLDVVVTGELDRLFDRPEPFVILGGANAANPCPFNGSLMMLRPGYRPDVWEDFSIDAARQMPFYEFPDDQGWLHHKIPDAATWQAGPESGIFAFKKPGWPNGDDLPTDARLVVFPGWRSPAKFSHLPWVKEHWRVD
jgi:hypothetical protein